MQALHPLRQTKIARLWHDGHQVGDDARPFHKAAPTDQNPRGTVGILWQEGANHRAAGFLHNDEFVCRYEVAIGNREDDLLQSLGFREFIESPQEPVMNLASPRRPDPPGSLVASKAERGGAWVVHAGQIHPPSC